MNIEKIVNELAATLQHAPRYAGKVFEVAELSSRPGEVYNLTVTLTRVGEPTMYDLLRVAEAK